MNKKVVTMNYYAEVTTTVVHLWYIFYTNCCTQSFLFLLVFSFRGYYVAIAKHANFPCKFFALIGYTVSNTRDSLRDSDNYLKNNDFSEKEM
jgi:hypothetical protein